jgi:hypothetical protein
LGCGFSSTGWYFGGTNPKPSARLLQEVGQFFVMGADIKKKREFALAPGRE